MRATETTSELEPVSGLDAGRPDRPTPRSTRGRRWRGLTGALTAGLVVLTVLVLAAQVNALISASEGPGPFMVVGHVVAVSLAVPAQRIADRTNGRPAALAAGAVLLLTLTTLTLFWWS